MHLYHEPSPTREPTRRRPRRPYMRIVMHVVLLVLLVVMSLPSRARANAFDVEPLPALPGDEPVAVVGSHGDWLIAIQEQGQPFTLANQPGAEWQPHGPLGLGLKDAVAVSTPEGMVVMDLGSGVATLLTAGEAELGQVRLPAPPTPLSDPLVGAVGSTIYLLSHASSDATYRVYSFDLADEDRAYVWKQHEPLALQAPELGDAAMMVFGTRIYVLGIDAEGQKRGYRLETGGPAWERQWKPAMPPPAWSPRTSAVAYGEAHVFLLVGKEQANHLYAYHTITDRWVEYGLPEQASQGPARLVARGGVPVVVAEGFAATLQPRSTPPRFRALDYLIVGVYLLGMIGIGAWFTRRENSADDFFRGGRRVPWWASGMSLFATLSSAISLMSMPRMGYASNWTYFAIGIGELLALPIAVWFLVPLVRRLNISTSNEYLERRFGVVARVMGSVIFILMQVGGRMAPVMLLPAIALEAITGIHVIYFILVMGLITTVYTYLGGLEAVVWTDTIQGFVMVGTIIACLVIVFMKVNTPGDVIVDSLVTEEKLKTFERHWSLVYPTMWMFLIYSFTTILMRLADQNFVQRVQCTPTLRQAKLAVVTQLGVAIPLNLLLFAVGTALWLFYRDKPDLVDPTIKTDSIYPFFAAQQMPLGIAGLVVAALLAATMSTISSSICSISDLCVSDFYKRFSRNATDHGCLVLGRGLTAVVGVLGTATAIFLSTLSSMAVWDLSVLIINMISLGVAGLFMLGLLTTRVSEAGAILGMVVAFVLVYIMRAYGWPFEIHFFLITFIGSVVTFVVGYAASLVLPGKPRNLDGLTVFTLPDSDDDDDASSPNPPRPVAAP